MQFERDCAIFLNFFPSLSLREFPCELKFLLARKFYAKAYKRRKVLQKKQASGHILRKRKRMNEHKTLRRKICKCECGLNGNVCISKTFFFFLTTVSVNDSKYF